MNPVRTVICSLAVVVTAAGSMAYAQQAPAAPPPTVPAPATATPVAPATPVSTPATEAQSPAPPTVPQGIKPPEDYIIGVDDVLTIAFWRDKDLSQDVVVRPDGKITLQLVNDLYAAGLTPDQLRELIIKEMTRFVEDPSPTVVVKQINSRKVYIVGAVAKNGPYPLSGPTTVMQLIAMAGGLNEFAKTDKITINRTENGKPITLPFDYKAFVNRKKLDLNIFLKPGDTVTVPF